jgi:hypothetical protein
MYCSGCLKQMLQKLNDNDVILLEYLNNENANIPQCSLSWQTIEEYYKDNDKITPHIIYTSMKRLNIFGFVETQKWTRKNKFYITQDGIKLLEIIQQNL